MKLIHCQSCSLMCGLCVVLIKGRNSDRENIYVIHDEAVELQPPSHSCSVSYNLVLVKKCYTI